MNDKFVAYVDKRISRKAQVNILCCLIGVLIALVFCRGCIQNPITRTVEIPVETIVYEPAVNQYNTEAALVAKVLYGLKDYHLSNEAKTAVIEVILNRVDDTACEFREINTVSDAVNQPGQWQGFDPDGSFLQEDYVLARNRLADKSGCRVIPEGCFFYTVSNGVVTVRTDFLEDGNEWKVH